MVKILVSPVISSTRIALDRGLASVSSPPSWRSRWSAPDENADPGAVDEGHAFEVDVDEEVALVLDELAQLLSKER